MARRASTGGRFVVVPLPAGSYVVRGTFLNATVNGRHPTVIKTVVIPPHRTVRQDLFLPIK